MRNNKRGFLIIVLLLSALFLFQISTIPQARADLGSVNFSMTRAALFVVNDTDLYFYDVSVDILVNVFRAGYHTYQYFVLIDSSFSLTALNYETEVNKTLGFFYPHTWSRSSGLMANPFSMNIYVNSSSVPYIIVPGKNLVGSSELVRYLMSASDVAVFNVTIPKNGHLTVNVVCTYTALISTATYRVSYIIGSSKIWYADTVERITAQIFHPQEVNVHFYPHGKTLKSNSVFKKYLWEIEVTSNSWNAISMDFYQYSDNYVGEEVPPTWLARMQEELIYLKENILGFLILVYTAMLSIAFYKKENAHQNVSKKSSMLKRLRKKE